MKNSLHFPVQFPIVFYTFQHLNSNRRCVSLFDSSAFISSIQLAFVALVRDCRLICCDFPINSQFTKIIGYSLFNVILQIVSFRFLSLISFSYVSLRIRYYVFF